MPLNTNQPTVKM